MNIRFGEYYIECDALRNDAGEVYRNFGLAAKVYNNIMSLGETINKINIPATILYIHTCECMRACGVYGEFMYP